MDVDSNLRVIGDLSYEGEMATPAKPLSCEDGTEFSDDYLKLFDDAKKADVTFLVNGEKIKAHKTILFARSTYFERMFDSDMKENLSDEVEVPDDDPEAFRGMLRYLYGGVAPPNLDDIAMDLFVLADKYGLEKLKTTCKTSIFANLGADTVVDALLLAYRYDNDDLMAEAKVVLRANIRAVKESNDYEKLKAEPNLLMALLLHYVEL